jgi:glycosyltransferase involved in cell wall biosynthesis
MATPAERPRALVVAYHFPPEANIGTLRTLRVVQHLARQNWDVMVLTSDPRTYRPATPVDEELARRVPTSVRIVRARAFRGLEAIKQMVRKPAAGGSAVAPGQPGGDPVPGSTLRSAVTRVADIVDAAFAIPDQEAAWLVPAVSGGLRACAGWRPGVVYSSAPPWTGQLVAYALATSLRARWVADFRDPWGRAPWRGDRFAFAMAAARGLERLVVRRADRIVFAAQGNRDEFAAHYGPELASKFHVVSNGCDPTEFEGVTRPSAPVIDPFVLLHTGSLYAGRTPVPLLRAIATGIRRGTIDPRRFRLRFLGTVALQLSHVTDVCRELGLDGIIEFAPRVPREQSLEAIASASALLLLQPGHAVAVPAKVYEYLAAGRPILAIAEGETAAIVQRSGIGVAAAGDDEEAIVAALERVMQMAAHPIVAPGREMFDGALRAAEIGAVLSDVVGRDGHAGMPAEAQAHKLRP